MLRFTVSELIPRTSPEVGPLFGAVSLLVLEEALSGFPGCAIVITHDRYFLNRVATHILAFEGDGKIVFSEGGYEIYEERKIVEQHTIEGERMLLRVGGLLGDVGRIVRACHERYDGTGYPDGLAGQDIPVLARIVSCCDAFNAMTTDRPYRLALPLSDAVAELIAHRGTQFDPQVVDHLVELLQDGEEPVDAEDEGACRPAAAA